MNPKQHVLVEIAKQKAFEKLINQTIARSIPILLQQPTIMPSLISFSSPSSWPVLVGCLVLMYVANSTQGLMGTKHPQRTSASSARRHMAADAGAERVNPEGMYNSVEYGFSHAAISSSSHRMLHLAGQTAWDENRQVVGEGDVVVQTRKVLDNLKQVLASQGATPADLVRIRTYVVNHTAEMLVPINQEIGKFYAEFDAVPAPNTWIGVTSLALPEFLVEIEATAILNES